MRLTLLSYGKIKTPGLRAAMDHYLKGLSHWCTVTEIELKALPIPDRAPHTRAKIQETEALLLLARWNPREKPLYLLDERGKTLPTTQWSQNLENHRHNSQADVAFAVGGAFGFSEDLRKQARGIFSFGPQTIAHELARVLLAEQLFRAVSLLHRHPYHIED